MHIPQNILVALLLLCCSWLGCKEKEEDEGLPDLSGGDTFILTIGSFCTKWWTVLIVIVKLT